MSAGEKKKLLWYLWGMLGILLAVMLSLMESGQGWNTDDFLNQDQTQKFTGNELIYNDETCVKLPQSDIYYVTADKAVLQIQDLYEKNNWKYMSLNISNLNQKTTYWNIVYSDRDGTVVSKQTVTLTDGDNIIEVSCRQPYQSIKLVIKEQIGLRFQINAIQFRMNDVVVDLQEVRVTFFFWLGLYIAASAIIYFIGKAKLHIIIEILQEGYCVIGNYIGKGFARKKWRKYFSVIRTGIFLLILTLGEIAGVRDWYSQETGYKYVMIVMSVSIFCLGLLCIERKLKVLDWNTIVVTAWLLLWLFVCISDIMQRKQYKFVGYVFLICVGFFFFTWNQMKNFQKIKWEMYQAFHINFIFVVLYCILFRTKIDGVLYNGPFASRAEFGIYSITATGIFLAGLYKKLEQNEEKLVWHLDIIWKIVNLVIAVLFLNYSDTGSCKLAFLSQIMIFGYSMYHGRTKIHIKVKILVRDVIVACCISGIFTVGINLAVSTLPEKLGTEIIYENEKLEIKAEISGLEKLQAEKPEYYSKISYAGYVNKREIWENYLQKLNLFGHADIMTINQVKTGAYNGWIEMMYRYGLFILLPYILLFISVLASAWRRKGELLYLIVPYMIIMLSQNIEMPFTEPLWILCYLGMGEYFIGKVKDKAVLERKKC